MRAAGWPDEFYERYRGVLARVDSSAAAAVRRDALNAAILAIGRKDQVPWDTPVAVEGGWQLERVPLRNPQSLDRAMPLTLDLTWSSPARRVSRDVVATFENRIPNARFLFASSGDAGGLAAWSAAGDSERASHILFCSVSRADERTSAVALGAGASTRAFAVDSQPIPLEPRLRHVLWSAWIHSDGGGNPYLFVSWFDKDFRRIGFDIPFQGRREEPDRCYAGVLHVPAAATYAQVRLSNFQATGDALFDNVLLVPLTVPLS